MAFDVKKYYAELDKLFKKGSPVRNKIANKIQLPGEVSSPVGTAQAFLKHVNNAYTSAIASYGQYSRLARYSDYDEMDQSNAEIASALDIYADEICAEDESGDILKIDSNNLEIKESLENLFYDTLNLEHNAFMWIRNMIKYGDAIFLIDHHPNYGVMTLLPMPINEVEREEGYDPQDPLAFRYRWITQGNRVLDPWQVVHFRLLNSTNYLPYGGSLLDPARRVWRQLMLLEDAVMVYRIVRSPERRVFYIGVGNISPQDVPAFMEKAKTNLKRNQVVDSSTGRVDLRYNPLSTDEDIFIPIRGEGDGTRIETLPGGQFTGDIEDLQYIQAKLFAALKIPKSYLGYEGDIGSKSTLSQLDVRFARTIKRIQRVFITELNKIAMIHLYSMGYDENDMTNFKLKMANPSTIAELQKLELWRAKFEVASIAQEGMFDRNFIYRNIWNLEDGQIELIEEGRRKDRMFDMELDTIQPPGQAGMGAAPAGAPGEEGAPTGEEPMGGGVPASAPPEAGLPPPPGEEGGAGGLPPMNASTEHAGETISDHRDPNAQVAAPSELMKVFTGKEEDLAALPDLKNYAFNTKKTAMDFKRNKSEMERFAFAPFGEGAEEPEETEEEGEEQVNESIFKNNKVFLKKMLRGIESSEPLKQVRRESIRRKKTKKIIL